MPDTYLCMANSYSRGDWQLEKPVAVRLPCVVVQARLLGCMSACLFFGRVTRQAP
jgi:hypothetical protein